MGALVGVVELKGCRPIDLIPLDELPAGPFPAEPGWWAWNISGARELRPVPCRGGQGLFEVGIVI